MTSSTRQVDAAAGNRQPPGVSTDGAALLSAPAVDRSLGCTRRRPRSCNRSSETDRLPCRSADVETLRPATWRAAKAYFDICLVNMEWGVSAGSDASVLVPCARRFESGCQGSMAPSDVRRLGAVQDLCVIVAAGRGLGRGTSRAWRSRVGPAPRDLSCHFVCDPTASPGRRRGRGGRPNSIASSAGKAQAADAPSRRAVGRGTGE
jgi:hypothetical protein